MKSADFLRVATLGLFLAVFLLAQGEKSCDAASETADTPAALTAAEIYSRCREGASRLLRIDYSFRVSYYGDQVQRVRADGLLIRVDARVPEMLRTGPSIGDTVDAFDGEKYQRLSASAGQLAVSRISVDQGSGVFGPCLMPLEQCYRWLMSTRGESIWHLIGNESAWAKFTPKDSVRSANLAGRKCHQLVFIRDNGVRCHLYIAPELNWFPVRREIYSPAGKLSGVTTASDFVALTGPDAQISWLPRLIKVTSISAPDGPIDRTLTYEILTEKARVGYPIDPEVLDLGKEFKDRIDYVYNLDSFEVIQAGQTIQAKLAAAGTPAVTPPAKATDGWLLGSLIRGGALLVSLLLIGFGIQFYRRREAHR
jgi:hypothetical protein